MNEIESLLVEAQNMVACGIPRVVAHELIRRALTLLAQKNLCAGVNHGTC